MTSPVIVRARTLGCEMDGHVHDLLLVGEGLYVLRLGKARRSSVDVGGLLRLIHWAAVIYSKIGLRDLATRYPDSSPGDVGAEIARARLRVASARESELLRLDPANLRADTTLVKAHCPKGLDVVELRGVFANAREPAGRQRILRLELAGDPFASLDRLLKLAGIPQI
jgi:hypothetical protein